MIICVGLEARILFVAHFFFQIVVFSLKFIIQQALPFGPVMVKTGARRSDDIHDSLSCLEY